MTTIITRNGKGSPLTYVEMDANLTNLNNDKLEASDLAAYETTVHAAATYATQTALATTNSNLATTNANLALTDAEVATKQDALPTQTGNNGKFLGTDGSNLSWQTVNALPDQTGNAGEFLTTNGSTASWAAIAAGEVTLNGVETLTNKTLTTPNINTSLNFTGTSGKIQVGGVDKVTVGTQGIESGSFKPGAIAQADLATAVLPLGVGQTRQNVTGSRTSGTVYTNSTGRPIEVSWVGTTSTTNSVTATVGGVLIQGSSEDNAGYIQSINFIVLSGETYQITWSGYSSNTWTEIR